MKAVDHCRFWSPAQHLLPSQNWGWSLFFVPSSIRGNGDQKRGRESQPPPVSSRTRAGPVTPIALSEQVLCTPHPSARPWGQQQEQEQPDPTGLRPSLLSLQAGPRVRGPEQHGADQACDPDLVSGVCPVSAPPQPERWAHRPGRLLHRTGQGTPFSWRNAHTSRGLDSAPEPNRGLQTRVFHCHSLHTPGQ